MARNLMVGPHTFLFSFWNGAEEDSALHPSKRRRRERDGGALVMDLLSIIITISRGP